MQNKSKKNASLILIVIGSITLITQLNKYLNEELKTSRIIAIISSIVIIVCGLISLKNYNRKQSGK
jgi:positive regulator of sigma E activity